MNIYLYLALAIVGFSIAIIFEKKTLKFIDPEKALIFKGILYLFFGIILFVSLKLLNKPIIGKEHKNYKKGILYLIIAYIIAFLLGNLLYYNVLQKTNEVTKVSFILIVFNTIISLILTYFIRGERINLKSLLGILVAVLGVSILLLY